MSAYYEKYGKAFAEEQERKRLERKRKIELAEEPPQHITSALVIYKVLAENLDATVEEIRQACAAAGVPTSAAMIQARMTSFKRVYRSLVEADKIIID